MGAGAYIGRIGGLAVALGVGTAIATGCGIASADTTPAGANANTSNTSANTNAGAAQTKSTTTTTSAATATTGAVPSAQTTASTSTNTAAPTGSALTTRTTQPTTPTSRPTKPTETQQVSPSTSPPKSTGNSIPTRSAAAPSTVNSAITVQSEPSTNTPQTATVLAGAVSPAASPVPMTAQISGPTAADTTPIAPPPPNPLAAVVDVVSSVANWVLGPLLGTTPTSPASPPLLWTLLAFARREFETFFGLAPDASSANVATTSLALSTAPTALVPTALNTAPTALVPTALAAATTNPQPAFPVPGEQLSASTNFVNWVTGDFPPNDTGARFSVVGTDVGTMWDNGIADNPTTGTVHQVLMAVGDTFSGPNQTGLWRPNTLFRSNTTNLAGGMLIPNGQWFNGNMFGGAPLGPNSTTARQIIFASGLPAGVTLIPTAGISVPTPGTQFGSTQYLSFMSVTQWGAPGYWTTNYSAIAYSTDNGENWTVAPSSVRYNQPWTGNQNFQQSAFVRPGDGYVYMYGTPNGRQGAAYVARVPEQSILDTTQYQYYNAGSYGWFWSTPAGWYQNNPAAATPVFGQDTGACGIANPGNEVSEMSVQYNKELNKYVVLYGDQFNNIVMRTSDTPQGTWGAATVLLTQQPGGIYAPMMNPWSPSTLGTGTDLYWNLSLSSEYNIMLMRTDLTKV